MSHEKNISAGKGTAFFAYMQKKSPRMAVIVLACIIFTAFSSSSTPTLDTSITTVTMIWKYIGEVIFNMLVLVGLIKGSDRIIKEMLGT